MEIQQRINQQRVRHIIDSYILMGNEAEAFEAYLGDLLNQYPTGLVELALVETLVKSWLTIPMSKGVPFLDAAHAKLKQWQQQATATVSLTPSQFSQITGLDAHTAFAALTQSRSRFPQPAAESP
ncbi:MAG: hypothetical protein AAFP20_05295 [Cyanobacteria bacterium J06614_10]